MRWFFFCFAGLLLVCATGCRQYRYVYAASKINAPALAKKGEARVNASFSLGNARGPNDSSANSGYDLQAAYAVSKHWLLLASHYFRNEQDKMVPFGRFDQPLVFRSSVVRYRRRLTEWGAGYYIRRDKHQPVLSLVGGMAVGTMAMQDAGRTDTAFYRRSLNADLRKYFLQPGMTFIMFDDARFDFSVRLSHVQYRHIRTNYSQEEVDWLVLRNLVDGNAMFFIETNIGYQYPLLRRAGLFLEGSLNTVTETGSNIARDWNLSLGLTWRPPIKKNPASP